MSFAKKVKGKSKGDLSYAADEKIESRKGEGEGKGNRTNQNN